MKYMITIAVCIFVSTAGWKLGDILSPDALAMAIGVLLGVAGGIPASLLILKSGRGRTPHRRTEQPQTHLNVTNVYLAQTGEKLCTAPRQQCGGANTTAPVQVVAQKRVSEIVS